MGSFYDDLAAQDSGTPAPAAPSFYDQLKSQDEEQGRLRVSVDSAMATTPEKAAKQKYLSLVTGLPESVVSTEEGEAQARAKVIEIQREAQFSPVLQAKLQDPKFTALALEDVSPLSKIEKGLRKFFDGGAYKQEAAYAAKVAGATAARTLGGATVGVGASAFDAEAVVFDWLSGLTKGILPVDIPGQIAASARGQANAARDSLDFFLPKAEGNLEAGLYSGGQSLGFNLATLPLAMEAAAVKGPEMAGHVMGLVAALATGAQTYNQGRDAGMGQIGATTFAAPAAMAEYLFEKWSGGKFFDDIAAKSGALKMLFNNATREVIGENATTLTQNFNEWLRLNPEKTVREFVAEQPDAMIQTTIAALVGAGGMTGAVKLMQQFGDVSVKQEDAQHQHALLQGIMQTAAGSKLRELDPDTFSRFVQDAANGTEGAPTSMFVDGNTLAEVLNQAGVTDEQLAQALPSVSSQLADALSMNSAVEIPIGELATALPGTPLEQAILPHLRTSEDAPSQREAQQAQANAQEFLQTSAQRVIDQAADGVKAAASAEAVRKTMFDQLMATGRMSEDVASKNATLVREWYTVMSSMMGTTPEELYKAMPYTVQGAGQRGALTQERAAVTDTPEFKTWFGDSKVVDAGGKPLVVYRGDRQGKTAFTGKDAFSRVQGNVFFTDEPGIAKGYTDLRGNSYIGARDMTDKHGMYRVHLAISNPLDVDAGGEAWDSIPVPKALRKKLKGAERIQIDDLAAYANKNRYDGLIVRNVVDQFGEGTQYVAFNPTQIKSATGNNGTFDGTDPNILNQSAKVALPKKQTATTAVDIRKGPALTGDQRMDIHQVGAYFDKIAGGAKDINDPKAFAKALKMAVAEIEHQLTTEKSGLDWYEQEIKTAFEVTQQVIPELADPAQRQLFSVIAGLQSPGTNARDNWAIAAEAFQSYKATGIVPGRNPKTGGLWQGGPVSANKEKSLNFLNAMIQDIGEAATLEWVMGTHTVKELNEARAKWGNMGPGVTGKAADTLMGLFAFGPKVGPFVMNINGIHELTIDVWATRTFNRYFGQMIGPDGKIIDAPTEPQRRVAKELFNAAAEKTGIKPYQVQSVLWFAEQQLFNHLGTGTPSYGFSDGARKFASNAGLGGGLGTSFGNAETSAGGVDGLLNQSGDRGGRDQSGGPAPLAGAPAIQGATGPDPRLVSVAEQYALDNGVPYKRQAEYVAVDPERAARIASAYDAMPHAPQDPAVKEAYANLIAQTVAQYRALEAAGYKFWFFDENSDPYQGNPWNAMRDLRANQSMAVFATEAGFGSGATALNTDDNPLLGDTGIEWSYGTPDGPKKRVLANDLFRAVHDAFGHGLEGAGFRAQGEENAWQAHSRMFTGSALGAITTETRGQNSWLNYGPHGVTNQTAKVEDTVFADQKTGLMPEWTWTEGRVADEETDTSVQNDQRRMRQALDLLILQPSDKPAAAPVPQTETPTFKTWFGDSKVVDAEGKPLVVYHGTDADFNEFDLSKFGHTDAGWFGKGFYFTDDKAVARRYGNVKSVYLTIEKPLPADSAAFDAKTIKKIIAKTKRLDPQFSPKDWLADDMVLEKSSLDQLANIYRAGAEPSKVLQAVTDITGFDGVVSKGIYIAFNPTQIKSATGNNGNFDGTKASILEQGPATHGRVDLKGVHFSKNARSFVDGRYYGTGLKGIERERLAYSPDPRIKERVYFYIDEGKGVRPESGVGGAAHEADLPNLYELSADPLKLIAGGDLNQTEINLLNAGFNGYYIRNAFNQQGAAVLLGDASRAVPVTPIANPTTKAPPLAVGPQVYKRGLMSKEANAMDITAIQAVAPSAKLRSGTFQVDESELEAARTIAKAQGIELPDMAPLQQPQAQGPRGTFNPGTLTTVLNENADLSTFLHETGHFFHEALMQMASMPDAPQEVKDLAAKALKVFGVKDIETWNAMDLEAKRPHYERFAETFELYLMTGKAPNIEIAGLFRTFRAWLTRVYKSLESFAQSKGITLDKDLTDVMDRMLASEAQIAEAEKVAGMVPELNATGEAIEQLQARSIRDLKWAVNARDRMIKALQKEAAVKRKAVEEEVTAEVDSTPEMRAKKALDALRVDPDYTVALKTWNDERAEQLKQNQETLESELRTANPDVKGLAKGQLMMKNKRQIAANAELRTLEWEKQNPKPKRPVNMTDADVATVADSFGYASPEAMVQAIDAYGPRDVAIEGIADQRMLERYGDLTDPEAIAAAATEAVHNQARAKSLATELAAQREMLNKRDDTGKTNAKGQKVTVNALMEAAKQFAANVIGRRQIGDLKKAANSHLQAERRAAKAWEAATAKGDTQAAVQAKQDQVLNNAAVRAAQDAQAEVKKTMEFFAKVTKGNSETVVEKGRDPDVVNAARAILAVYGIAPFKGKNAFEYMSLVQANDPQMFAVLDASVKAAVTSAKPVGQMTVDELSALRDEIDSMWHLAKASREYEVDGNKMDIADAGEELKNRMVAKGIPDRIPGEGHAVTESERAGRSLQFAGALLRRVEQWAEGMDGKFGGPFLRLVFQPVKEAANRYRTDRVVYREAFTKLVENLSPAIKPGLIEAPEIGYTFGKGKGTAGAAELTHAILHLGNESNKRKLLLGRQWATENPDGTLNTDKWDAFIKRMHDTGVITKMHYDFAQGVWDLLEKMKPLAQKTHRDVFGRYFAEVTADVLGTPFGDYRGGYVPAQVDPEIVKDNEIRKLAEMENENMSYAFPSTNKGFTKSRTEYNRPLLLDIRTLGQHMDKVLLFSHMEPAVRGVSKVLQEKGVAYSMNRIDPSAVSGMLTPWLNRSARQVVETPVVGDGRISRVLSVVRARAGMSVMFANVSNTLQQVAGLALAGVKVKPSHLASAMAAYVASPKKTSEAVAKASEFMANRMDDQISALNGTMEEILLNPSAYESAQAWTQKHAYFLQSALDNVIGPVVWTGAYNQAIGQGMEEKDAVRFADGTIRQTQGSTLAEDISRIETGPAYARVFTQFIGYFNMVANTNATALQNIADDVGLKKGAGKALAVVFMGLLAPAWIAEAIAVAMKGGPDDDNKDGSYLADWLMAVFGMGTLKTLLAGVPFVGQFAMAGVNTWNDKPYDDRTNLSPAVSMLEGSVGAPRSVYKALVDNGSKQKAVRDVATAVSLATGLPASAIARPLGYLAGTADHKINPTSGADEARGLITGTASPQSKQQ